MVNLHRVAAWSRERRRAKKVLVHHSVEVEGWLTAELVDPRTKRVDGTWHWRNLIVNAGLDGLGEYSTQTMSTYCGVGTDNTAPANGQTALGAQLARTNVDGGFAIETGYDAVARYGWFRRTFVFTTAQANGILAEVGLFRLSTGAPMLSRSLIKDGGGSPTTIPKTSDYELRIIYEFRIYHEAETTYSSIVNLVPMIMVTTRAARNTQNGVVPLAILHPSASATVYNVATGTLGVETSGPSGTLYAASSVVVAAYTPGNYYRDATATWMASNANASLRSFCYSSTSGANTVAYGTQHQLPVAVTKTNTQRLDITVRLSWTRRP